MAANPRKKKIDNPGGQVWTKEDGTELPMVATKVIRFGKPSGMYWVATDGSNTYMRPIR